MRVSQQGACILSTVWWKFPFANSMLELVKFACWEEWIMEMQNEQATSDQELGYYRRILQPHGRHFRNWGVKTTAGIHAPAKSYGRYFWNRISFPNGNDPLWTCLTWGKGAEFIWNSSLLPTGSCTNLVPVFDVLVWCTTPWKYTLFVNGKFLQTILLVNVKGPFSVHAKVCIFSQAIGPEYSMYNVGMRGSPVLCTMSLLPSQPLNTRGAS